jgi:hypothetical protein
MGGFSQSTVALISWGSLRFIQRRAPKSKICHVQSGIAMLEAVIFISLGIAVVIPVLIFVIIPKFMATSLNERISLGYESTAVSTNDLAQLNMEGLSSPRDFASKQVVVQSAVNQLQKLTNLPAGTFCGAVLTTLVDQSGTAGPVQLDSAFTDAGAGVPTCDDIGDVPADAVNSFLSSLDLRQPGIQTGFTVFAGNVYSRMRSTTAKANKGFAP